MAIRGLHTDGIEVDGVMYALTLNTGETSFGQRGSLAFAYDYEEFLAAAVKARTYQDLCDAISPIDDADELRRIAIHVAARKEYRLAHPGACLPVLSDSEYDLVRAAVWAVR